MLMTTQRATISCRRPQQQKGRQGVCRCRSFHFASARSVECTAAQARAITMCWCRRVRFACHCSSRSWCRGLVRSGRRSSRGLTNRQRRTFVARRTAGSVRALSTVVPRQRRASVVPSSCMLSCGASLAPWLSDRFGRCSRYVLPRLAHEGRSALLHVGLIEYHAAHDTEMRHNATLGPLTPAPREPETKGYGFKW